MDLYTFGVNFHYGYVFNELVTHKAEALTEASSSEYCKIIHLADGVYHLSLNGSEYVINGSYAMFLNEADRVFFHERPHNSLTILFFKPSVINSKFGKIIEIDRKNLSTSDSQDYEFLFKFKANANTSEKILSLNSFDSALIQQRLQLLEEQLTLQQTSFWPCRSRALLLEILFSLARPEENTQSSFCPVQILPSYSELSVKVINFIQANYNQKLTIEKLSQKFCTNRTTLLSDFKKSTGLSLNQYIIKLRIEIAASLLRDTQLHISEICLRTGFSDISYFSKAFKKELIHSPSEYRKINQQSCACANLSL